MSAILKMLEAGNKATEAPWHESDGQIIQTQHVTRDVWIIPRCDADLELIAASRNATADIQRLVSWVESAEHKNECEIKTHVFGTKCICGLDEIQSLLRS